MDIESSLVGTLLRHGTRRIKKKYYHRNRSHRYLGDTYVFVCIFPFLVRFTYTRTLRKEKKTVQLNFTRYYTGRDCRVCLIDGLNLI